MNRAKLIFLLLIASLVGPIAIMVMVPTKRDGDLFVYCAAGMRKPMAAIATRYEEEYGVKVDLQFAGSGTLLGNLEASGKGDLYLAADASYIDIAREKRLVEESLPAAKLTAGLLVPKGNPLGLTSLADLRDRPDLRIVLANPEAASAGKFTKKVLSKAGLWGEISARVLSMKPTVNDLANDLKLGAADVAIAWDALGGQYPELDFVHVPEFDAERKTVTIGLLATARVPAEALRFARYATARDRGLENFAAHGFDVLEGDKWERVPELVFFSGAMLGPAIRERMERFKGREGVGLKFVPNGCGILVSKMKAGARPDAYFSCDVSFMDEVEDLFGESQTVSANDIVLLVADGAKGKVTSAADLAAPGLRVGLAHPENSALGALTVRLLDALGVAVGDNKQLDSSTGDFLINQLLAGSLDAVVVYRSNAMAHPPTLDSTHIVEIDHPLAVAHQPFAAGLNSDHKQLVARLFEALTGAEGKEQFLKYGFRWELGDPDNG